MYDIINTQGSDNRSFQHLEYPTRVRGATPKVANQTNEGAGGRCMMLRLPIVLKG